MLLHRNLSPILVLQLRTIFCFCFFFTISSEGNPKYLNCAPQKCSGITIRYPFFLPSQSIDGCGYLGFSLTCINQNKTLLLQTPNFNLTIISIDYGTQSINATIPTGLIVDAGNCSYPKSTIEPPFPFKITSSYRKETLYYNCSNQPSMNASTSDSGAYGSSVSYDFTEKLVPSCSIAAADSYSYAFFDSDSPLGVADMSCETTVTFPVLATFSPPDLAASLSSGFLLTWSLASTPDCAICTRSDGRCGMNTTTGSFVCLCPDDNQPSSCSGPIDSSVSGSKVKMITAVTAGSAVLIVGMLLGFCYFLYYQARKKPSPSAVYRSRSFSTSKTSNSSSADMESSSFHQKRGDRVTLFTYRELQEATNDFHSSNEIGGGGFGSVFFGKLQDGRKVAVKRLYENNYRRVEQFMNEIEILSSIRHPNLVCLYGCTSRHSRELLLVYEYINNGTVSDHIHGSRDRKDHMTWKVRLSIAIETAEALAYLHRLDPPIVHRDVKTTNILLHHNFHVKVADFGLSRLFPVDVTHVSTAPQGTPGYVDPDYHKCYQLTDKSDVYSFGVVLSELISSLPAVDIRRHRHEINLANLAINKIQNQELHEFVDPSIGFKTDEWVKKTVTAVAELVFRCLAAERELRPTMDEVGESLRKIKSTGCEPENKTV